MQTVVAHSKNTDLKLEHLTDINPDNPKDDLIRLFDFDHQQAKDFQDIVRDKILTDKQAVDLKSLDFIESINCSLTLSLSNKDNGIQRINVDKFDCQLTDNLYRQMIELLQPFVDNETNGYQWLYDLGADTTPTEFLFSSKGTW